jgi:hypothetical protein
LKPAGRSGRHEWLFVPTSKPTYHGVRRKPAKVRADILGQARAAETLARRELRLFRRVAMTAAAELAAAFERLGAARARVELLRNLRKRRP